jgi:hypothetical protein
MTVSAMKHFPATGEATFPLHSRRASGDGSVNEQQNDGTDQSAEECVLYRRGDREVMLEDEAAERTADVGPDDAQKSRRYPAHGLPAGHEESRERADDQPNDDHPDDVQNHGDSLVDSTACGPILDTSLAAN